MQEITMAELLETIRTLPEDTDLEVVTDIWPKKEDDYGYA